MLGDGSVCKEQREHWVFTESGAMGLCTEECHGLTKASTKLKAAAHSLHHHQDQEENQKGKKPVGWGREILIVKAKGPQKTQVN